MERKRKVVFVGAFNTRSGNMGGQLYACLSLLNSPLSNLFEWKLVDTTAPTNLKRGFISRLMQACSRVAQFLFLTSSGSSTTLIFFADRASFIEKGMMAVIGRMLGKKVVLCPRSGLLISDISDSRFWRIFSRLIFTTANVVICQSISWKVFFESQTQLNSSRFRVIPNWISAEQYQQNFDIQKERTKQGTLKILFLGWVTREKGVFELIEAFERLMKHDVELWVAGDGQDLAEIQTIIKTKEIEQRVKLFGWVQGDRKTYLLQNSDIFVLPSYYEGLPNSVLEAMMSGIPVIATKVGGLPDLIEDGVTGYLVEPKNSQQLAEKLTDLISSSDKRKQFSLAGHRYVSENHSLSNAVKKFEEIL